MSEKYQESEKPKKYKKVKMKRLFQENDYGYYLEEQVVKHSNKTFEINQEKVRFEALEDQAKVIHHMLHHLQMKYSYEEFYYCDEILKPIFKIKLPKRNTSIMEFLLKNYQSKAYQREASELKNFLYYSEEAKLKVNIIEVDEREYKIVGEKTDVQYAKKILDDSISGIYQNRKKIRIKSTELDDDLVEVQINSYLEGVTGVEIQFHKLDEENKNNKDFQNDISKYDRCIRIYGIQYEDCNPGFELNRSKFVSVSDAKRQLVECLDPNRVITKKYETDFDLHEDKVYLTRLCENKEKLVQLIEGFSETDKIEFEFELMKLIYRITSQK
jgi:hypothetical protein